VSDPYFALDIGKNSVDEMFLVVRWVKVLIEEKGQRTVGRHG
jgi:hypothetical protein